MAACPVQVTQMKYRLSEGSGECFYYIGAPAAAGLCMVLLCTRGLHDGWCGSITPENREAV